jgi:hypothetical protein
MSGSIWLAVAVEAAEDVGEVGLGIWGSTALSFAGLNRGDQALLDAALVGAGGQGVLAIEGDRADRTRSTTLDPHKCTIERDLDHRRHRAVRGRRIRRADHRYERQLRRRQREAPLLRLVPPGEQLLWPQIVPMRHFRDHHPRRQAPGHDRRLRLGAPPAANPASR